MYTVPMPYTKLNQHTREQLGEAIYLLGYLIHKANWETASLVTSQRTITKETGWPDATIRRWMQALAEAGEISTRRVASGTMIQLNDYDDIARTRKVPPRKSKINSEAQAKDGASGEPDAAHHQLKNGAPSDHLRRTAGNDSPHEPEMTHLSLRNGGLNEPNLAHLPLKNEQTNINRILSQNKRENEFQNDSPSLDDKKGASSPPLCSGERSMGNGSGYPLRQQADRSNMKPREIFDYTDPRDVKIAEAKEYMATLSDDDRESVEQKALQDISRDFRPFIRIFARLGDDGRFHPSSKTGEEMMLLRIGEML